MKAPHFWSHGLDPRSREAAPLTRALLTPISKLYTWGIRRKLRRAVPVSVAVPIICVGNVTVGGVGKTPIVKALRQHLLNSGIRAASLSRGHGGSEAGPLRVDLAAHTASDVGDEPLMLATTGESWIGKDRLAAANAMIGDGVQVIVMDDGMQNPALEKDLTLMVIDAAAPFGNGHVLPKGPLREPVSDGVARADAVILMGSSLSESFAAGVGKPVYRAALTPDGRVPVGPLVAFAGIGRPQKFFDGLTGAGAKLAEAVSYNDHYVYTSSDLKFLHALARTHDARLVTTEKDYARLPASSREGILAFPVSAKFSEPGDLETILKPIIAAVRND